MYHFLILIEQVLRYMVFDVRSCDGRLILFYQISSDYHLILLLIELLFMVRFGILIPLLEYETVQFFHEIFNMYSLKMSFFDLNIVFWIVYLNLNRVFISSRHDMCVLYALCLSCTYVDTAIISSHTLVVSCVLFTCFGIVCFEVRRCCISLVLIENGTWI